MRCMHCMREMEDNAPICSFCGTPADAPQENADALPLGTVLRNRFLVGRELGRGGFGITYIGFDQYLECRVAIKEYYPQSLAARLPGESNVFWRNSQMRDTGCRSVIREAQKMHRLGDLSVAVRVQDVFLANNTAYIAMDFVEGVTLKSYLMKNGVLPPERCLKLIMPVVDTMSQMHREGIIHRDISPDNIMIQPDHTPRLLDLGAAKDTQTSTGTTMLVARNGFSPWEQYQTNGSIGPWTDVYALCATIYYCLTGKVPPAAIDRLGNEELTFRSPFPLPGALCDTIRNGMRVSPQQRISDMTELKRCLENSMMPEVIPPPPPDIPPKPPVQPENIIQSQPHPVPRSQPRGYSPPPEPEKPKGLLTSLLSRFGGKTKPAQPAKAAPRKDTERRPMTVAVSQPFAPPQFRDPNATVCIDSGDSEGTVLFDEEPSASVQGFLVHRSSGKQIPITRCCFILGRLTSEAQHTGSQEVDYMIPDNTRHVSRRHAAILFDGADFFLQDISGRNATLLNGVRIQNAVLPENRDVFSAAYPLFDGDSIQLATEQFTFRERRTL